MLFFLRRSFLSTNSNHPWIDPNCDEHLPFVFKAMLRCLLSNLTLWLHLIIFIIPLSADVKTLRFASVFQIWPFTKNFLHFLQKKSISVIFWRFCFHSILDFWYFYWLSTYLIPILLLCPRSSLMSVMKRVRWTPLFSASYQQLFSCIKLIKHSTTSKFVSFFSYIYIYMQMTWGQVIAPRNGPCFHLFFKTHWRIIN